MTASVLTTGTQPTRNQPAEQRASLPAPEPGTPRVRIRPAPRREPPFDDGGPGARHLRLVHADERPLPFPHEAVRPPLPWCTPTQLGAAPGLADPVVFGRRLLIAVLETLAGRRPAPQLARHISQPVYQGLFAAGNVDRAGNWRGGGTVRSVHVGHPDPLVAELAAVVAIGGRVRAAAIRLEARDGHWCATRLQLG